MAFAIARRGLNGHPSSQSIFPPTEPTNSLSLGFISSAHTQSQHNSEEMAAPPAPALAEVLLGEIIHRFPPDDPACLFRATAVCRAWRAFVTNADVIRRYRAFHEAPPVLGLLQNRDPAAAWGPEPPPRERVQPRFFATAALPRSIRLPNIQGDYPHVLDCRHGRVLVHTLFPLRLVVCNPITGQQQFLPAYPLLLYSCFSAAVLCAVGDCDHLHCGGGAFRVVFTATLNTSTHDQADPDDPDFTWASLYSSETGVWTDPTVIHPGPLMVDSNDVMGPSLLAGGAVYCTLDLANSRTVLRYDLGGGAALSVMNMPPLFRTRRDTFLVTVEGGGLGFAAVEENYRLRLWSWNEGVSALWREIDLTMMIPFTIGGPTTELKVIGFAEMSRVIFVIANGVIVSTLELESGEISEVRVRGTLNSTTIFPFESFYTPGTVGASCASTYSVLHSSHNNNVVHHKLVLFG